MRSRLGFPTENGVDPLDGYGENGDENTYNRSNTISGIGVFPLAFPPSAVMVPNSRRERQQSTPYAPLMSGHVSTTSEYDSRRVSAEAIANVIKEDMRLLGDDCSVRARPNVAVKEVTRNGRILHV